MRFFYIFSLMTDIRQSVPNCLVFPNAIAPFVNRQSNWAIACSARLYSWLLPICYVRQSLDVQYPKIHSQEH
jgi:hypothetical protein